MTTIIYQDVIDACLLAAQKLYKTQKPSCDLAWRVSIDGNTAGISINPQGVCLNLPFLPLDARLTKDERDLWVGYVIHELGHALFTDFYAWRRAISEGVHDLVNGLEDPRIEGCLLRNGVATNARAMLEKLTDQKLSEANARAYDPADLSNLAYTLAVYGRIHCQGYDLANAPALDPDLAARLSWIWPRLTACASTSDVLALAHDVAAWRAAQVQAAQEPKESAQGKQGDQKQDNEGDQDQDTKDQGDQGDQDSEDQDQEKDSEGEGDQDDQDSEAQDAAPTGGEGGENKGGDAPTHAQDAPKIDVEPNLTSQTDEVLKRLKARDARTDRADRAIVKIPRIKPKLTEKTTRHTGMKTIEDVFPSTAKLKADLTRLVKSPERVAHQHGLLAGRLDRRAFGRIAGGATNVFSRRQVTEGVNAAVSMVLDGSGSMRGVREKYAAALAVAMGDALDRAAVPFEISRTGRGRSDYVEGVDIMKPYSVAWRKRRDLIPMATPYEHTCNLVGAASAVDRLKTVRGATRRILFVLSDGQDDFSPEAWRRAQVLWARAGIETIGIGFQYDVSHIFKDSATIYDAAQLAREGLGALTRKLKHAA